VWRQARAHVRDLGRAAARGRLAVGRAGPQGSDSCNSPDSAAARAAASTAPRGSASPEALQGAGAAPGDFLASLEDDGPRPPGRAQIGRTETEMPAACRAPAASRRAADAAICTAAARAARPDRERVRRACRRHGTRPPTNRRSRAGCAGPAASAGRSKKSLTCVVRAVVVEGLVARPGELEDLEVLVGARVALVLVR